MLRYISCVIILQSEFRNPGWTTLDLVVHIGNDKIAALLLTHGAQHSLAYVASGIPKAKCTICKKDKDHHYHHSNCNAYCLCFCCNCSLKRMSDDHNKFTHVRTLQCVHYKTRRDQQVVHDQVVEQVVETLQVLRVKRSPSLCFWKKKILKTRKHAARNTFA